VIFIGIFIFLPDSPHYYVTKRERQKAIKALAFLRQSDEVDVMEELVEIEASIAESSQNRAKFVDVFRGPNMKGTN
jgi:hypothetical protein